MYRLQKLHSEAAFLPRCLVLHAVIFICIEELTAHSDTLRRIYESPTLFPKLSLGVTEGRVSDDKSFTTLLDFFSYTERDEKGGGGREGGVKGKEADGGKWKEGE